MPSSVPTNEEFLGVQQSLETLSGTVESEIRAVNDRVSALPAPITPEVTGIDIQKLSDQDILISQAIKDLNFKVDNLPTPTTPPPTGSGSAMGPVIDLGFYGVSSSNSAVVNGKAIRSTVAAFPSRHIRFPLGVIEIDAVQGGAESVNPLRGGSYGCFWLESNSTLEIPSGTIIRFMGPSTIKGRIAVVAASEHRLISNRNMDGSNGGDRDITVIGGGVIDGNTTTLRNGSGGTLGAFAGTSDSSRKITGLTFWKAARISVNDITIQDFHGENGSGGECFHSDFIRCYDVWVNRVKIKKTGTIGGSVSTGFSNSYCSNVHYSQCTVDKMDVQGYTSFGSRNVTFEQCRASGNKRGFNFEFCWDVVMDACVAGGMGARYPKNSTSDTSSPFLSDGQPLGNTEVGIHVIFGENNGTMAGGGGNYRFSNCLVNGQQALNARGFAFHSYAGFVAATGTTGNTIIAPSTGHISKAWVGGYVKFGNGKLTRITSVSGTTVTTDGLHNGIPGATVLYCPARISISGCSISENFRGIQILGGTQPLSRSLEIRDTTFNGNLNQDLQDIARGDTGAFSIKRFASGLDVTANVTYVPNGVAFQNPLPFDVVVYLTSATSVRVGDRYADPATLSSRPTQHPVLLSPGGWLNASAQAAQWVVA